MISRAQPGTSRPYFPENLGGAQILHARVSHPFSSVEEPRIDDLTLPGVVPAHTSGIVYASTLPCPMPWRMGLQFFLVQVPDQFPLAMGVGGSFTSIGR